MKILFSDKVKDIKLEGDIHDMSRKSKERFTQMDIGLVNAVKEEVMNGMSDNHSEEDQEMIQEMESITREETAVGYESANSFEENSKSGDVINLGEKSMPAFGSLSEKTKIEESNGDDKEQMSTEEFNETRNEVLDSKSEFEKKKELREANKLKRDMRSKLKQLDSENDDKSWELNNVQIVLRDGKPYKYLVSLSCMQLAEWYISKKLIYDFGVQRGSKTNKKGEEVPILFLKHCNDIKTAILDGSIHGGTLSLNLPTDNNTQLFYDEDNMTLSSDVPLTINDGFHRIYASYLWYKEFVKPNSTCKSPETFYFPANIEHISRQASCDLFKEYAVMGKSISKNRISVHNVFDKNYEITQRVAKSSQLRGRIEMISNSIKRSSPCIFTYGTILNGVSEFKVITQGKEEEVGNFIIEFLNELIELFPNLMGHVDSETRAIEKQKSFVLEKMFQNSYFVLASQLQGKDDWKSRLAKLTQNNFLSRSNPMWGFCLREGEKIVNSSKVQKTITEKIIDYVMAN